MTVHDELADLKARYEALLASQAQICVNPDCPRPGRAFRNRDNRVVYCSRKCAAVHRWAKHRARQRPADDAPGSIFTDLPVDTTQPAVYIPRRRWR